MGREIKNGMEMYEFRYNDEPFLVQVMTYTIHHRPVGVETIRCEKCDLSPHRQHPTTLRRPKWTK